LCSFWGEGSKRGKTCGSRVETAPFIANPLRILLGLVADKPPLI
jgi:hypothetical protein